MQGYVSVRPPESTHLVLTTAPVRRVFKLTEGGYACQGMSVRTPVSTHIVLSLLQVCPERFKLSEDGYSYQGIYL